MLRSRDRSIAVRSGKKNCLRLSTNLFYSSISFCPMCRTNASALLRFAIYSKDNRPEKLCFTAKTVCIIFRWSISRLISFALSTNNGTDVDSIDRWMTIHHHGTDTSSSTFASHNQSANVVADLSRYISHKLEIIDNRFFGRIRWAFFLDKIGVRRWLRSEMTHVRFCLSR